MKKLAVVITTHMTNPKESIHRHSNYHGIARHEDLLFRYFKDICLNNYWTLSSGLEDNEWDIYIVDTGSQHDDYQSWIGEQEKLDKINLIQVENFGGAWAGLKTFMHTHSYLAYDYENFIFHVDDGVEPLADGWATDMIEKYNALPNMGIMGRKLETILLGPQGLPEHREICAHIAAMWGILENTRIPHLHGDYWFLNQETLMSLAEHWWHPGESREAMQYQIKYEQMNFKDLFHLSLHETGTQRYFEDMHIGREVDMPLRMKRLVKKSLGEYKNEGILFKAEQINHRQDEILQKVTL